jgi:acylglycerol lipase
MSHTTEKITAADGLELFINTWKAAETKAVVVIAHGLAEHSGRYAHVAENLNAVGYSVVAPDHRGHGQSGGEPRTYVTDMDTYVDDLKLVWDWAVAQYAGLPVFLLGHSMGGLIAVRFALRYQAEMRGLVVSAPALLPGESIPKLVISLGKIIGKIVPKLPMVALDSADVSRDPMVVARYDSDPLNYRGKIRAGMAAAVFLAGEDALRRVDELRLPLLAMHGADDRLVPVEASRLLHDGAGSTDKALKVYAELYHEIFNEPEQDAVLADVVSWLDGQLVN